MRLGRLPHDAGRLALVPGHRAAAAPPPPRLDRPISWRPTLLHNDTAPTCTVAGLSNAARAAAEVHGWDQVTDEDRELAFYAAVAGCGDTLAAIEATDGLMMLDVLERAVAQGFDVGQQVPLVPVFAAIPPTDRIQMADAIAAHGAAYIGVDLTQGDMVAGMWTDPSPGPVAGGHCIVAWGYTGLGDDDTLSIATWGDWKTASWSWLLARTQEVYSVGWPQAGA